MNLHRPPHQLVATVIGAGTMGAQIAAHLANAGVRTHLLDIVPKDAGKGAPKAARDAVSAVALKKMLKGKPAPFMDVAFASRITVGNLDDDLESAVGASDLVIEVVIERLDIKRPLFERIGKAAPEHAVLATNTSGLPIGDIVEGLPEGVRRRVVGMHWFNPPRYMHLLEIVPSAHTDPAVAEALGTFSDRVLGKGVVVCRDTPNFIGNRIGIAEMMLTFQATFDGGYTVEEVDLLNGKLMGRPNTGSFRLGDLVGIDVAALVIENLAKATSGDPGQPNYDELHHLMTVPEAFGKMFEMGLRGDKTGQGFYKKTKERDEKGRSKILSLDLTTLEYRARQEPSFPELAAANKEKGLPARIAAALRAEGRAGDFLRKVYLPLFNYAANRLGEIADDPGSIDDAMCWGYRWSLGPFAMWDAAGFRWVIDQMKAAGITPAPIAAKLLEQHGDDARWFHGSEAEPTMVSAEAGTHVPVPRTEGILVLAQRKGEVGVVASNKSASLIDLGDGIACVEFHAKMNAIDEGIATMLSTAVDRAVESGEFRAIVVGNQGSHFSAGANLFVILALAGQSKWDELDQFVHSFQQTMMKLRHSPVPVVTAPFGMTLGGGAEVTLAADAVVADAELYMGLVEAGVGLVPAGGGLKEIARRASEWATLAPDTDPYPWLRRGFESAAQGKVSTSAHEALGLGYLRPTDAIVFNKRRVLAEAKRRAIGMAEAGYVPPDPNAPITVIGASGGANFLMGAAQFEWGGYASEHDRLIGEKIAHVITGGMRPVPGTMTAQELLDLEREAFVSLAGTQKTRDRIAHTLKTGKPLRN
ncbi:MAG: 3-hydroxyacyl-CoA dehydrogenase/enoyl-CoA hydratase family protein [Myxococcales bacterium]|nr:3-hydroxyacyl-CoA dehydrogenase/enoyl-CoA hydratase family protein [Myxococcales bacterium]MCB9713173.1 3-hydroxyacyl-CoA dehydrogenase/enoyl-CoA hydratase family protein [Myxococcales bacterium]